MSRVPSYYARPDRLHSHEDMMRVLKERTKQRVDASVGAAITSPVVAEVLDGQSPLISKATPSTGGGVQTSLALADSAPHRSPRPASESSAPQGEAGDRTGPRVSLLEWLPAVKNPETGCYTVKDTLGAYTVVAERTSGGKGWQYLAFKGSAVLAPACGTAECAKAHAQADADRSADGVSENQNG